ncbi:uncharacterized protein LOC132061290 [Lycium ferocissimum]|uniref:uncharacterized protein LOC132061290 n=1 Tax=Lycium ferocissimum TaxID=112874 RepID=UPI002814E0F1|nr:uncharacterized protein LOC132061290 [Lycium ferocissimum]
MVDFDVIMGMDWLSACYANMDCRHKLVRFAFPDEPVIVWEGEIAKPRNRFISYLNAHKMIAKGCIYHLVAVNDTKSLVPEFASFPIVSDYPKVFPEDLPCIPPDRNREDYANHLKITLTTPEENQLYAKFSKCEFWLESVSFFGHVVTGDGIKVDHQKVSAVKDWPRPTSAAEIRSFLGLANYYQKFVEGFLSIASPLIKLTQKTAKFQWSKACEKSFQELKTKLTSVPILTLPSGSGGYVVYCDASRIGLGYVLMQNDALSRKSIGTLAYLRAHDMPMGKKIRRLASLGVRLDETKDGELVGITPSRILRLQGRLYVPDVDGLRQELMMESHSSKYSVMVEHQRSGALAQNIEIPQWKKGKLSPCSIGPYEITKRVGKVAYELRLPAEMSMVHPVFHISMLRLYQPDPSHVLNHEDIEIDEALSYEEEPVQILYRQLEG